MVLRTLPAVILVTLVPTAALAQTMGGKGVGLDGLDEQQVMARLASSGLTALLDRDMDVFQVPAAERDQQKALIELSRLAAATDLKPPDRRALAERVARDLDPMVDRATDPVGLTQQAYQLFNAGVQPTVSELEYFGDNPTTGAQLRPVAETVRHMLRRVVEIYKARAATLAGQVTDANVNQMQPKLTALRTPRRQAEYSDQMASYPLAISYPKGDTKRAALADPAITYLRDNFNAQPQVRLQIGKLQLAKGDYPSAKATLATLVDPAHDLRKPPAPSEQDAARYFSAVADLLAGHLDEAAADADALDDWERKSYLSTLSSAEQDQVRAAGSMLRFRIASARSDAATDPAERRRLNDQAVGILSDLLQQQSDPALRDLVFDQVATRIPAKPDYATLDPLALQALLQQGFDQYNKKEGEPVDRDVLQRAIAAAKELVKRAGQPGTGVTQATAVNAAYFVPYALELKLHDDAAAATAYMDFMERFPNEPDKATDAMQHAGALVFKMHRAAVAADRPDPAEVKLYDRFLPLAIDPPFNQKQVAIDYADALRGQGKYAEAVKYYDLVPRDDKRYPAGRFRELLALYGQLRETDVPPDQRKPLAERLQALAGEVDKAASAEVAAAATDADRQAALGRLAVARYDAAISARRDLHDPAKSLQWLDGFEDRIKGLGNANEFAQTVVVQRVNAYMDQGRTADATAAMVGLLAANPEAGEGVLFDLIHQIDHDLAAAKGAHDAAAERQLAANKAQLSGFLVTYAQQSKDPAVRAQLDSYRLYDAESKRQAAELADDPSVRERDLQAALAQYQALAHGDPTPPAVLLGIGLTQYDLGHYREAEAGLSPLVSKRLIGQPTMDVDGHTVENPQFWEATYKQLRSIAEVAKANPNDPTAKDHLARGKAYLGSLFVIYGKQTGGAGYHDEFIKLRDELVGGGK